MAGIQPVIMIGVLVVILVVVPVVVPVVAVVVVVVMVLVVVTVMAVSELRVARDGQQRQAQVVPVWW